MLGFGDKKEDVVQPQVDKKSGSDILKGVTFHVMPSLEGVSDLGMAHSGSKAAPEKKEAPKAQQNAVVAAANKEESLAPPRVAPPPPKPPPVLAQKPPVAHGAGKIKESKKKFPVWGIAVIVLLVAVGFTVGGWLWYSSGTLDSSREAISISSAPEPEQPATTASPSTEIVEPSAPATTTTTDHFLASRDLQAAMDTDNDGLTDLEEDLYGTDPTLPDTDQDGWPDGWEIVNMYDPTSGMAGRLADSPQVTGFRNSRYGYAVLHPQVWVVQSVDRTDPKEIVVTSATGEYINILSLVISGTEIVDEQSLMQAIRAQYPGGDRHKLLPLENKFGAWAVTTEDGLTAFVGKGTSLWVFRYEPGLRNNVNFSRTMAMMASGFFVEEPAPSQETQTTTSTSTPTSDPVATSTDQGI